MTITYQPISLFKWQIYASQSMRNQWQNNFLTGEEDEDDQDTLKEAILETNPYLLALTFAVSILHSIFEFLAFKNGESIRQIDLYSFVRKVLNHKSFFYVQQTFNFGIIDKV